MQTEKKKKRNFFLISIFFLTIIIIIIFKSINGGKIDKRSSSIKNNRKVTCEDYIEEEDDIGLNEQIFPNDFPLATRELLSIHSDFEINPELLKEWLKITSDYKEIKSWVEFCGSNGFLYAEWLNKNFRYNGNLPDFLNSWSDKAKEKVKDSYLEDLKKKSR